MCYETSKTEKKVQTVRIIYCGDVVARAGRDAVLNNLSKLRERYKPDAVIVNIENAAHGFGASPSICRQFLDAGVDALVTGNHVWQQRDLIPFLDECKRIVRPLNYPEGLPGKGAIEIELPNGKKILIAQLLGRLFMEAVDCPAQAIDKLLKNYTLGKNINAIFVDIHAEATAEKIEIGHYLDGAFRPLSVRIRIFRRQTTVSETAGPPIRPMSACAATITLSSALTRPSRSTVCCANIPADG